MVGAGAAQGSAYDVQRRYDYAYLQCMYATGNRVPVPGGMSGGYEGAPRAAPPMPPPGVQPPPPRY
ncbi:hypothetical protein BUB20358_05677 [Burkholderia ubonensis]|nr:hypothetical protein BUB20358_05677 [Burkholderia ubonensis]